MSQKLNVDFTFQFQKLVFSTFFNSSIFMNPHCTTKQTFFVREFTVNYMGRKEREYDKYSHFRV